MSLISFLQSRNSVFSQYPRILLAGTWISGTTLGIIFYTANRATFSVLMRGMTLHSVSIVWILFSIVFLYLLCGVSAFVSLPCIIYITSTLKGIAFSAWSLYFIECYPSGWLVRFLIMFFEIFNLPILYACWHQALSPNRPSVLTYIGGFIISLSIFALDYHFISPIVSGFMIL